MQRIFDIKPRRALKPVVQPKPKPALTETLKAPVLTRSKRAFPKSVSGILILVAVATYVLVAYVLPEARIEIQARAEPVARDFEIRVDSRLAEPDFAGAAVPGKILEEELVGSKSHASTGVRNIGRKASGFVYIYNFSKTISFTR